MINHVDHILRGALLHGIPALTPAHIGLQPPDAAWRQRTAPTGVSVNVHLADITEDAGLRTNERHREISQGLVTDIPAPARMRLHYLISAWSAGQESDQLKAAEDEHAMLGAVLAALLRRAPLTPVRFLGWDDLQALPVELRDGELPTRVAPAEGFSRLAELWGTMGRPQAWKPVVYVMVTAPVVYPRTEAGGIVDTILVDLGQEVGPQPPGAAAERELVVGGHVRDSSGTPVARARVDLLSAAGTLRGRTTSDGGGGFSFDGLSPGPYWLAASHERFGAVPPLTVTVPLPSGAVELVLT